MTLTLLTVGMIGMRKARSAAQSGGFDAESGGFLPNPVDPVAEGTVLTAYPVWEGAKVN